jgi:hypothetical protein
MRRVGSGAALVTKARVVGGVAAQTGVRSMPMSGRWRCGGAGVTTAAGEQCLFG